MATLAEGVYALHALGFYQAVFPFLLVLALMYGILSKVKPFGDNKLVNSIVSFVVAMFFIAIARSSKFLLNLLPLITAMLLVMLLIILVFRFIGVEESQIKEVIMTEPTAYVSIIAILIIIIFIVIAQTYPENAVVSQPELLDQFNVTQEAAGSQGLANYLSQQATSIIFSPMILGVIILLVLFGVATYMITREAEGVGGKK
jgi:hypothetical protein